MTEVVREKNGHHNMEKELIGNDAGRPSGFAPTHDEYLALSLYEKKSLLINRELDKMGMGRYQWCIWVLCGFGYWLDLMWAQVFGLVLSPITQEMGVPAEEQGNIFSLFSAGLTVGALFWGLATDVIGRKWAFNLTCLITCIFGTLVAAPRYNWSAVIAITFLCGLGLGGNIPIDATIALEFLPQNRRFLLATLSLFQPLGVTVCTAIAFGLVPRYRCDLELPSCNTGETPCCTVSSNMGWRYQLIVLGGITLGVFILRFVVFNFRESPKYLLSRGREEEAIEVVHSIAKFNRAPVPDLDISHFRALEQEYTQTSDQPLTGGTKPLDTKQATAVVTKRAWRSVTHLKSLFTTKMAIFSFAVLAIAYMSDFWSFNLAGGFLPIILQRRGVAAGQSVTETYRQYIYIYTPGIIGSFLATAAVELPRVGRKYAMVFGAIMQGVSIFLYITVKTIAASVGLNALEYIFQTYYAAILYAYTPEVFPAPYRASASGMLSTLGRLSGIVAPFAAAPYNNADSNGILYLAGGAALVSALAVLFLPVETRRRQTY